jgi:hypothetical protein
MSDEGFANHTVTIQRDLRSILGLRTSNSEKRAIVLNQIAGTSHQTLSMTSTRFTDVMYCDDRVEETVLVDTYDAKAGSWLITFGRNASAPVRITITLGVTTRLIVTYLNSELDPEYVQNVIMRTMTALMYLN